MTALAAPAPPGPLIVRARARLAGGIGALMEVRVAGVSIGSVEVRSTEYADYTFNPGTVQVGSTVDLVYENDATIGGVERQLYVAYVTQGSTVVSPQAPSVVIDRGAGAAAFDGIDLLPGQSGVYWNAALRMVWPSATATAPPAAKIDAARFLLQASFGPTAADVDNAAAQPYSAWIDQQTRLPATPSYVDYVQSKFDLGPDYRPGGSKYSLNWAGQKFWSTAATAPDQLRRRVAYALHMIFVTSLGNGDMKNHLRPYANYLDLLNKDALGNFRALLDDVALSPAMGIYLSSIRNQKEDPTVGRSPDENFAREVMQLMTIGLYELNADGTTKLGADGKPIETYDNDDVMALARVFTGWSWGFADSQLTEANFKSASPDYATTGADRSDLQKMKAYPGMSSSAEKRLFDGKSSAVTIPANASAADGVRMALDALFKHPNTAPFISRQLIQKLVTSNPSPAFVGRVAAKFVNNGSGVRGDMAAVVRAILLDSEARAAPKAGFGRLREPIQRTAIWLRAFGVPSASGDYIMAGEPANLQQRALYAPSVFGYYRPGYVPPNTSFARSGSVAPEFQIVGEVTTAQWVNLTYAMALGGIGWTGSSNDMVAAYPAQTAILQTAGPTALTDNLNLLLFAGRMTQGLRLRLIEALAGVGGSTGDAYATRARLAVFLAMSSPEYLLQP